MSHVSKDQLKTTLHAIGICIIHSLKGRGKISSMCRLWLANLTIDHPWQQLPAAVFVLCCT